MQQERQQKHFTISIIWGQIGIPKSEPVSMLTDKLGYKVNHFSSVVNVYDK